MKVKKICERLMKISDLQFHYIQEFKNLSDEELAEQGCEDIAALREYIEAYLQQHARVSAEMDQRMAERFRS